MKSKRLYETTFILNASLEDSQIESAIGHIAEVITRNGGEITATYRWGRKRLAYPIQKKNNGCYVNIEYLDEGGVNAQLERTYTLDENILRFLTIQVDKKAMKARQQQQATAAAAQPPPPTPAPPTPPPQPSAQIQPEAPKQREPLFDDDAAAAGGSSQSPKHTQS